MPLDEANKTIEILTSAIDEIYEERAAVMDYQKLFDLAYKLVTKKYGEKLYDKVRQTISKHTKGVCNDINQQKEITFLPHLLTVWKKYRKAACTIRDLLLFLDEQWVERQSTHDNKIKTVFELGIFIFREEVLIKLTDRVQSIMLSIIRKERDNIEPADKFLLRSLTQMMVEIDKEKVYIPVFESKFLSESHIYYKIEAEKIFDSCTAVDYLKKIQQRLKEETDRADRCLDPETRNKIENVVKEEFITRYKDSVVNKEGSGVLVMLKDKKETELRLVYDVLGLVEGALEPTINIYREYVTEQGLAIVTSEEKNNDYITLVTEIIQLRVYYDELLLRISKTRKTNTFIRDKDFSKATKDAFDRVVNQNEKFSEYLSLLLDKKLKKGKQQIEEEQLDTFFDQVIMIFRHVKDKDIFEKYYKEHLAVRLLEERCASDDAEKLFLSKLKTEFGVQFTTRLENMFKDIKLSKDLMGQWNEYRTRPPIDMNIQVLTQGSWPGTTSYKIEFSEQDINKSMNVFNDFYQGQHNGRKLTWQYQLGNASIIMNGFTQKFEITASTFQMAVLLLFNDNEKLTYKEIETSTKIPAAELKKNLIQLTKPLDDGEQYKKVAKVLTVKASEDQQQSTAEGDKKKFTISATTIFATNNLFKSRKLKMNAMPPMTKQTEEGASKINQQVEEERKMVVDAVIVRIMKSRKVMTHRDLVLEATSQLQQRFMPAPNLIKKRIENLIEREYLERDENDRQTYKYLA
ncbi:predicted protein [Naegleria gruberi]|uniref:Predicted protein n=1 Tax=Naegleria gruberi TaxID=5762 RepID=D2V8H7_NAEGR|nr:uncharacterized protein NAEGRDRAFT_31990 [Naegleria gruberi]EFC46686.1 predicted protein [Naegleria gruberi]|eukprot:XP_002679430.1 predicted protein [Naegleria gruberi strain NEG-M]